jgi:hypothetical protein
MEPWQSSFYPTCNLLHQVDQQSFDATLLSTRGSWRTAWLLQEQKVVLKMLHYDRDYDQESFSYHQRDAMAMERLTASKYTTNVHGFCGQSVWVEFAPHDCRGTGKKEKQIVC